jgi:hypothetical protein
LVLRYLSHAHWLKLDPCKRFTRKQNECLPQAIPKIACPNPLSDRLVRLCEGRAAQEVPVAS